MTDGGVGTLAGLGDITDETIRNVLAKRPARAGSVPRDDDVREVS